MSWVRWFLVVPGIVALSGPVAGQTSLEKAGGEGILCKLPQKMPMIPPALALIYFPAGHRALVYDGYVKDVYGHPIDAGVSEDTPEHLVLKWLVRNITGHDNHGATVEYDLKFEATYVKGPQDLFLTVSFLGGAENPPYSGHLACTHA